MLLFIHALFISIALYFYSNRNIVSGFRFVNKVAHNQKTTQYQKNDYVICTFKPLICAL